jgi:hypothetical protein
LKEAEILEQLKALRQDVETQTAINVIEGINTAETLALLGHFVRKRRAPTPGEAAELERFARQRWTEQVRQMVALARREAGGLDASLGTMLGRIGERPRAAKRGSRTRS